MNHIQIVVHHRCHHRHCLCMSFLAKHCVAYIFCQTSSKQSNSRRTTFMELLITATSNHRLRASDCMRMTSVVFLLIYIPNHEHRRKMVATETTLPWSQWCLFVQLSIRRGRPDTSCTHSWCVSSVLRTQTPYRLQTRRIPFTAETRHRVNLPNVIGNTIQSKNLT